ncbi:MAG: NAD(P)/FAD-dependent oxidoreductase [Pseudobdellovibrio sp.]
MRKKIAVIGSGISGLGASLILSQQYEIHLFESDNRLGGHAHTSDIKVGDEVVALDTGFLVYNELTYPHLIGMLKYLGVETVDSDMSLSIQVPYLNLEWSGDNLNTVFAQRKNLLRPRFYRLLLDILKFHRNAELNRDLSRKHQWTVEELLVNKKFSNELTEWYILPMLAAIWSTPETKMLDFPADTFLTFFLNHKLLQVNDRPKWKTIKNSSRDYVNKIAAKLEHIHLSEGVESVQKEDQQIRLQTAKQDYLFDKVIFATAPAITRNILKTDNLDVLRVLNSFETVMNKAYLHQDDSFMPQSKKCWSSWCVRANYRTPQSNNVSLTYYLNRLQPLKTKRDVFLTLNPGTTPKNILAEFVYGHPLFNQRAISAQPEVPSIQGIDGVYYAGAWTRYGFHEDGLLSGVRVSQILDVRPQWDTK